MSSHYYIPDNYFFGFKIYISATFLKVDSLFFLNKKYIEKLACRIPPPLPIGNHCANICYWVRYIFIHNSYKCLIDLHINQIQKKMLVQNNFWQYLILQQLIELESSSNKKLIENILVYGIFFFFHYFLTIFYSNFWNTENK